MSARLSRTIVAAFLLGALQLAGATMVNLGLTDPAAAQFYQRRGGGFFDSLFGPRRFGPIERDIPMQQPAESSSRAPTAKKSDTTPTLTVMVLGDSMADWLGYGLEEAFSLAERRHGQRLELRGPATELRPHGQTRGVMGLDEGGEEEAAVGGGDGEGLGGV